MKNSGVPTSGLAPVWSSWSRQTLREQFLRRGAAYDDVAGADQVLDPEALTIGFARRFATYKRGTLLFRDMDRLRRLLEDTKRPIQFLFAGKAHPADHEGKDLIKQIVNFARDPSVRRKIVFLENYDMNVARYLVQGVDVWLNTPRRPYEASGTSGMKAAANGVLNCSVLDGWWVEGYAPDLGWAIGRGETYADSNLPGPGRKPGAIRSAGEADHPRVLRPRRGRHAPGMDRAHEELHAPARAGLQHQPNGPELHREFYIPALDRGRLLRGDGMKRAIELAHAKDKLRHKWADPSRSSAFTPAATATSRSATACRSKPLVDLPGVRAPMT